MHLLENAECHAHLAAMGICVLSSVTGQLYLICLDQVGSSSCTVSLEYPKREIFVTASTVVYPHRYLIIFSWVLLPPIQSLIIIFATAMIDLRTMHVGAIPKCSEKP